jgi:oxygen-dependent protoporphyrinogen oxidase
MELPEPPHFTAVLRPRSGIPQLEAGYTGLLEWRKSVHAAHDQLHLCGFGWKGIGINDMTKEARQVALRIGAQSTKGEQHEVKGVYF